MPWTFGPVPSPLMVSRRYAPLVFMLLGCGGTQQEWNRTLDLPQEYRVASEASFPSSRQRPYARRTIVIRESAEESFEEGIAEAPRAEGGGEDLGVFGNTYYDFPVDRTPGKGAVIYDAQCRKIAEVSQRFHDSVCVQGSGRIASGQTVSFARRDCECASVCPRTGQKICFEPLDPERFPWGRGAMGKPIKPLLSVAVDTSVIPFGTKLFIPDAVGLPREDGSPHDGCFIAQDRGLRIVGNRIDIFTGDPSMTAVWNQRLPSHRGVRVIANAPECAGI